MEVEPLKTCRNKWSVGRKVVALSLLMVSIIASPGIAAPTDPDKSEVWHDVDRLPSLERMLIVAVKPQIDAAITGIYSVPRLFHSPRITRIQQNTKYPGILRAVIQVNTFVGAHNPLGVDTFEFVFTPDGLEIRGANHQAAPPP